MQLTWFSALVVAAVSSLPARAVSASTSVACAGGEVLSDNTVVTANNHKLRVVTQSCPGVLGRRGLEKRDASRLKKRQSNFSVCTLEASIECADLGPELSYDGCQSLTAALEDLGGETFSAPLETVTSFTQDDGCVFAFYNPTDDYDFDVCYNTVGEMGWLAASSCIDDGGGYGFDEISDTPEWYVEVYN